MTESCRNCGQKLSEENIRLGLEDAGEDAEACLSEVRGEEDADRLIRFDHYTFNCPSYSDERRRCRGYRWEDREKPAYWIFS